MSGQAELQADHRELLVYGGVHGPYGDADDPHVAAWRDGLRALAAADGLPLYPASGIDMATRPYAICELADRDGGYGGWPWREPPRAFEQVWGETLQAAQRRAQVGRFTPPPPVDLRDELAAVYSEGLRLCPAEGQRQRLIEVARPTGIALRPRALHDRAFTDRFLASGGSWRAAGPEPRCLHPILPAGELDLGEFDLDDLEPLKARIRAQLRAIWGERYAWVCAWARGEGGRR